MTAYYNEFDPFAADWLEELIKDGLIAPGVVDRRSVLEVEPNDYKEFTQHHFFAGIGGWSRALRLAGWSDSRPVCTASLPCQPFSTAGKQLAEDDERHLLPHFMHLVAQSGFNTIFGEQVDAAIRLGWADALHTEMEREGYATGFAVLGAHSVGAPHRRQRMYWVSESVADSINAGQCADSRTGCGVEASISRHNAGGGRTSDGMGDTFSERQQRECRSWQEGITESSAVDWRATRKLWCTDGKHRPVPLEPTLFPVAARLPNRVGILRGAGNAIVATLGAAFIKAYMETK